MSATLILPNVAEGEQRLVLTGINWGQYVTISDALPDRPCLRLIYLDGRLTFLGTSRRHDRLAERMGHLVVAVANGCGILWEPAGQATFRLEGRGAGVEGDKTYYFGVNAERMLGPQDIDLTTQPPPDLAIEVEVTHPADEAMATWGRLGVPEVWRFGSDHGTLGFWLRRDDGTYAPAVRSAGLSVLEPGDVLGQLRLAEELGSARWYAQLDGWVRDVLVPRRGGGV
jgi:Uma2 family endonuclease